MYASIKAKNNNKGHICIAKITLRLDRIKYILLLKSNIVCRTRVQVESFWDLNAKEGREVLNDVIERQQELWGEYSHLTSIEIEKEGNAVKV